jgi:hypothetical protein
VHVVPPWKKAANRDAAHSSVHGRGRGREGADGAYLFAHVLGEATIRFSHPERCDERIKDLTIGEGEAFDAPVMFLHGGGTILCRVVNIPAGMDRLSIGYRWQENPDGYGGLMGTRSSGFLESELAHAFKNLHPGTHRFSLSVGKSDEPASPGAVGTEPPQRSSWWSREVALPEGVGQVEVTIDLATPPDPR